jgi:hypothetical protein
MTGRFQACSEPEQPISNASPPQPPALERQRQVGFGDDDEAAGNSGSAGTTPSIGIDTLAPTVAT